MTYNYAIERRDYARIDKLNTINRSSEVFDSVQKWSRRAGCHAGGRWQILAEARYDELKEQEKEI